MKKTFLVRVLAIFVIMALSVSLMVQAQSNSTVNYGDKLDLLVELLKEYHLDMDENEDPIRRGLIKMFEDYPGTFESFVNIMYQSYDPYSYYMEPQTYDAAFPEDKTRVGIGISIIEESDGCYIQSVTPGGPANKTGLSEGDKLISVDGKKLTGYTPSMIVDLMTGEEGASVKIGVLRGEQEHVFTVIREQLTVSNVSFKNMGNNIAYLKLSEFNGYTTFIDFCIYYEMIRDSGYKSVILDLRDNPGGDIDCFINIMDQIIPDKDVPYLMVRKSNPMSLKTYSSEGYGWKFNNMTILVNENTASAAEVLAGALQDLGYAEVVGVPTHGKGLGQSHIELDDGSYAIISSHALLLPITGSYTGVGIKPKHYTELTYQKQQMPSYEELDFSRGVYRAISVNVRGIEQRLNKMGYFNDTPDEQADFKTYHAINQFQKKNGLEVTDASCDAATVRAIDDAFKKFINTPVVVDTQLERAMAIARFAANNNLKPKPIDKSKIRFTAE